MNIRAKSFLSLLVVLFFISEAAFSQRSLVTHTRGKLWETLTSYGLIGSSGAWDYAEVTGLGFYPGFAGYNFPNDELLANGPEKITDANFHNFRSGPWIIVKDVQSLEPPEYTPKPKDFLMYHASLTPEKFGTIMNYSPFVTTENFVEKDEFNPALPEEMHSTIVPTVTGITMKQRSMAWSFPGYRDFIIYDYVFKNTGDMVITALNSIKKHEQTLNEVWIVFHSGISVSTKGTLNFHYNPNDFLSSSAPAGGFGGYKSFPGSDVYQIENEEVGDGKGLLYFSRDFNGGRQPVPWDGWAIKRNWRELLKLKPEWEPELQDPACYGFEFLYRTPPPGAAADPFDADPSFFSIYNDFGDSFGNLNLDFNESFGLGKLQVQQLYNFAKHNFLRENDGTLYAWYTASFGPYTLAPGDSIRLIVAEVAGSLSMNEVVKGDPDHHFPDSSIAAILRHAENARNAVKWGFGTKVNGIDINADVPEAPPAPNCSAVNASAGLDTAIIAVRWEKNSEEKIILDGAGQPFYDGSTDLSGYRVYRGTDKRGVWNLIADIPRSEFQNYWKADISKYEFLDKDLQFGFEFYYYVEAYNSHPKPWTSINGTLVSTLPELRSGDFNKTNLVFAKPGPIDINKLGWDVFVAPNPFIADDPNYNFGPENMKIEFRKLPMKAVIKIFNVSGELVKTLNHGPDEFGNLSGSIGWDQKSDSGLLVAPGLYIYVVESEAPDSQGKQFTGKLMIIR